MKEKAGSRIHFTFQSLVGVPFWQTGNSVYHFHILAG